MTMRQIPQTDPAIRPSWRKKTAVDWKCKRVDGPLVACHQSDLWAVDCVPESDGSVAGTAGYIVWIWMELHNLELGDNVLVCSIDTLPDSRSVREQIAHLDVGIMPDKHTQWLRLVGGPKPCSTIMATRCKIITVRGEADVPHGKWVAFVGYETCPGLQTPQSN